MTVSLSLTFSVMVRRMFIGCADVELFCHRDCHGRCEFEGERAQIVVVEWAVRCSI